MNQNADFDRIAQSWLQDGPTEMPDRSLQAALDEVHETSQQRFGAARRVNPMNGNTWRIAAAAVIGLLIIIGGGIYLGNNSSGGIGAPGPTATPSSSSTPSASPAMLENASQAACVPGGAHQCLAPGTYRLTGDVWPGEITMNVPAGWFEWQPYTWDDAFDGILVDAGTGQGSGWGLEFIGVGVVAKDPCDPTKGTYDPAETGTVDGLVAAMSRLPGFEATAPSPTIVGGYDGQLIELTSTRTATDCPNASLWTIPQGGTVDGYPMVGAVGKARAGTFRIVD
ncbi:MAG TPA: hypothetical protein VMT36_06635, partial [Candidatus Saccharimonadia bacterium]|nr:hypothetical protein [Candidatus Saccharimonadia bacterium]